MKLVWDKTGERLYETGVDNGVLYPIQTGGTFNKGVAWNGLTAVTESPSGAEASPIYADNIKYLSLTGAENFEGTIEAFYSPDEFDQCDGIAEIAKGVKAHQQTRKSFGFAYLSIIGNDVKENDHGTKLHLWYGCKASPSERSYATVNDSPEPANPSWSVTSVPVEVPGKRPSSVLTLDSTKMEPAKWNKIMDVIYGSESTEAHLPLPVDIMELLK